MTQRPILLLLTTLLAMSTVGHCFADIKAVALPGDFADFAMHPRSGNLVALNATGGQAVYFRAADLAEGKAEAAAQLRVGSTPVSVFFKQFKETRVFAVVCSQDTHMYLINADDFTLAAKVELSEGGVSYVTGSRNPKDPFIYYCYGSGHDSATGAVSLRDMKDKGLAFDDSMDCAISASGNVAYRRGPWSPSGFESLIRTSTLDADKPTFTRLFYDHNSTAQYVPGPFDRFTASGTSIYTKSLEKNVASLDFIPMAFFSDRPVVVGIVSTNRFGSRRTTDTTVKLRAASYNTFSNIGDQIVLQPRKAGGDGVLPRGVRSQADFKRVGTRMRLFADEARNQVVFANRGDVFFVPVDEFNLPEEPLLLADLHGADDVSVGEPSRLKLVPRDPRIEVTVDDLPEGMKRDGMEFSWTPNDDAMGTASLVVTLKHADIQRTLNLDVNVTFPHTRLPFAPASMSVTPDGKQAVIWEGPALDRYGRISATPASAAYRIAVINVANGETRTERKLASAVRQGLISGDNFIGWTQNAAPKCEVLGLDDLQRRKSLVTGGPITHCETAGRLLIVRTQTQVEIYDTKTWQRVKTVPAGRINRNAAASVVGPHGLYLKNTLYDFDLKPTLLASAHGLPTLAGADQKALAAFSQRLQQAHPAQAPARLNPSGSGTSRVATSRIPGSNSLVALDQIRNQIQVTGSTHTWRTSYELAVSTTGDRTGRQTLVRKNLHAQTAATTQTRRPIVRATATHAYVIEGENLYQWPLPAVVGDDKSAPPQLQLVPKQTALTLSGTDETVLKHEVTGGKAPVRFSIFSPYDGLKIDEATGTITVNNAAMAKEALDTLERQIVQASRGGSHVDALRNQVVQMEEAAAALIGRKPAGVPVAIPIRIAASDADLADSNLQYFLLAEVSSPLIMQRMRELDETRMKRIAEAQAGKEAQRVKGNEATDSAALARRVEALESRVDLLTRQLSDLLKKLDK